MVLHTLTFTYAAAKRLHRMTALMNQRTLLKAVRSYREEGVADRVPNARQPIAPSYLADRCTQSISAFIAAQPNSSARRGMTEALTKYMDGALIPRLDELPVWKRLIRDYGDEKIFFVNSGNYRKSGPRVDYVGVKTEGEARPWPCEVVAYFGDDLLLLVLVRDFVYVVRREASRGGMDAAVVRKSLATDVKAYSVIEVDMISGHAHLAPKFTGVEGERRGNLFYYDDIVVY